MMKMRKSGLRRYVAALACVGIALALGGVAASFAVRPPYETLWIGAAAVVFAAWCCGLTPSIITAILTTLGAWFLFVTPHNFLATPTRTDILELCTYLFVSGLIVALGEVKRRSQFARIHQAHVLDAANDAIIELNPSDDTIKYWNLGAEKLYGWKKEEAVGRNIDDLLKTTSFQSADQSKAALMRDGTWQDELIHTRRDGMQIYVASRATLQHETQYQPAILLEINRDITERKKAEQELQKAEDERRIARELALKELENQVRERTAELEQSNQQLRLLSASLIRSQDDERRRIARELHDSAGQYLGAVNIALEVARREQDAAISKLAEADQIAKQCAAEIRTISHLLHPPLLEELGLASAVHWYVEGFAIRSGIEVNVEIPKELDRLGNGVELVLFRILQEALTNIHRHSGSKTAAIQIGTDSQQVWLDIRDHGNGIASPSGQFRPGIGITGMRERVKDLCGTLDIHSDASGTRVRAVLPLAADRRQNQSELKSSSATG